MEVHVQAAPNQQMAATHPDARATTTGKGTGAVGYNLQTAVDGKDHLFVARRRLGAAALRAGLPQPKDGGLGRADLRDRLAPHPKADADHLRGRLA